MTLDPTGFISLGQAIDYVTSELHAYLRMAQVVPSAPIHKLRYLQEIFDDEFRQDSKLIKMLHGGIYPRMVNTMAKFVKTPSGIALQIVCTS